LASLARAVLYSALLACPPATLAAAAATPGGGRAASTERMMLPAAVTPLQYRIDITPDSGTLTFKGAVDIDLIVNEATDQIMLNSADLVIDRATLSGEAHAPIIAFDERVQTASFGFGHKLARGPYTLKIEYHGKIYKQTSGLFALDYDMPQGKAHALFTQFENSDARRFVPCWDEPGKKASFALSVTVPADQMAISNMPIVSSEPLAGGLQHVHFDMTPKMSSYLLFFGLGDFERVHRQIDGVDLGVVVKRGDTASAAYALDAAAGLLSYYNNYFEMPFPLPKLDLIGGPGSGGFGAMENWGAIFYSERLLLIDAHLSTQADRQTVFQVIAHEMAHQWFGDLVTMAWWDDLWLNEGFASWMQSKAIDHFHPEWRIWLQTLEANQGAMELDEREGTHPIITPIYDVLQASGAFDAITYSKGAAVIRTLESYLGEEPFRAGVRRYIRQHAYGNAVTDDLWKELDAGSARPIAQIAHDFTLQAGVPMVSELSWQCADDKTTLSLAQGHFAIDADSTKARDWHVPVNIAPLGGTATTTTVFGPHPKTLVIAGCDPLILNAGQSAYFRSHYPKEALAAILARYRELSPDDQLGIMNDTTSLAYAGEQPMADFLDLAKKFPIDANPVVISALIQHLQKLDHVYDGLPAQGAFRDYARAVLAPAFVRVGWDPQADERDNVALLRMDLIAALGEWGDPAVLAEAHKRFERFLADSSTLDAEKRRAVLRVVAVQADALTWDQLHHLAMSAQSPLERQELYRLLARPQDRALAQKALDLALSGEPPGTSVLEMISMASYRHPELAFDVAVAHWDALAPRLSAGRQPRYVPRLVGEASEPRLLDKLDDFAREHIPPSARLDLQKSKANIRYLASIRKDRLPEVDAWLKLPASQ
jgi:aminopeptidase N